MKPAQRIPVLMYHGVGDAHNDWERRYCVPCKRFAGHMHRLAAEGMRACSLEDFSAWMAGDRQLPEGSFLLTFDDGFLGVFEHASPVLRDLGWPATVFLVSGLIGERNEWCRTENPSGVTHPLLAITHIKTMRREGFAFQSHTRHHPDLMTLSEQELTNELAGSRRDLEDLLGEPVSYLAYPYGRFDQRVLEAVRQAGYQAAFSTQPGFNRAGGDLFRVRRLDVFGTDTAPMLARKIFFGSNDGSLRQAVRYYSSRLMGRFGKGVFR